MVIKGKKEDYIDIIEFASKVFKQNFYNMVPKVYNKHPEMSEFHYMIKENNEIKAEACSIPMDYYVYGEKLNGRGIGTVSVDINSRNKGYMKQLMDEMHKDARAEKVDFLCLGGKRKRYEFHEYGQGGTQLVYTVTKYNRQYSTVDTSKITLLPLCENMQYLQKCLQLHNSQKIFTKRSERDFTDVMGNCLVAIDCDNNFIGYISLRKTSVKEFYCVDYNYFEHIICSVIDYLDSDFDIYVGWQDKELITLLNEISEKSRIESFEMIAIINYQHIVETLLKGKAKEVKLLDGEYVFEVIDFGKWKITVKNNDVKVESTEEKADKTLSTSRMIEWLFLPNSTALYTTAIEKSFFPLPLQLNAMDMV